MSFIFMFRKVWFYAGKDKWKILTYYVLHFLSNLAVLMQPYAIGRVFSVLQNGGREVFYNSSLWAGFYILCFFMFNIFHRTGRFIEETSAFSAKQHMSIALYNKLNLLPPEWHSEHHSGDVINRINRSSDALLHFSENQFQYIEYFMMFWGPLIALTLVSYKITLLATIISFFAIFIIFKFDTKLVKFYSLENELLHKYSAGLFDFISNIRTIVTLRLHKQTESELIKRFNAIYPNVVSTEKLDQLKWFLVSLAILVLEICVLLMYIYDQTSTEPLVMIGSTIMVFQYLKQLSGTFFNIGATYSGIVRWKTDFCSADIIEKAIPRAIQERVIANWSKIKISNLIFSYNKNKQILSNVSIELVKGRKIAFIGESGSGKSTLLSILRGLYQTRGTFLVDGKIVEQNEISSSCTLIPQDAELFENTILFNITLGVEPEENSLKDAISLACLNPTINRLENGINTDIREKGVNLSGGEKQRLCLARGLYSVNDSQLILLDEPSSSVDSINEQQLFKNIISKYEDRCIVAAIHSLHLLPLFDYIYLFDQGVIVQQGSFADLTNSSGSFQNLWKNSMTIN